MSNIQIFNHPQFGAIRTTGTPDTPEFCAMDLCRSLGYTNGRKAVKDHCAEEDVTKRYTPTNGGDQELTYVNESGMYALVLGSKLPQAKQFKHWVTSEVLPSIRKHGAYMTTATIEKVMNDPDSWIKLLTTLKEERHNPDAPEFCAMDLCRSLGYTNGRKAVKDHCAEEDVTKRYTPTNGGEQELTYVNESGMYALVLGSKLPQAKQFKHWVTSEVLPSIRKHGAYMTTATIEKVMNDPDSWIKLLTTLKEERQQRQIAESKAALLEEVTKEQAPKVAFADAIIGSDTNITIRNLAKLLRQNGYETGEKRLYEWLRKNGYITLDNKPMQRYVEQGIFFIAEGTHSENGVMKAHMTTKVTPKGQQYFINKLITK